MKRPDYHHPSAYYAETLAQFYRDVERPNDYLAHRLVDAHHTFHSQEKNDISESEFNSWCVSPKVLATYLQQTNLPLDLIIVLEARIDSWRRVDAFICGKARKNQDSIIALEMKQWSPSDWFDLKAAATEDKSILTVTNGQEKFEKNPCDKLVKRIATISEDCSNVLGKDSLEFHSYILLHNHEGLISAKWSKIFSDARKRAPIITDCESGRDYFKRRIKYEVGQSSGMSAYQKFLELALWNREFSPEIE